MASRANARLLLLSLLCAFGSAIASPLSAQPQQRITLSLNQATVQQAVNRIAESTRYKFTYLREDLPASPRRDFAFNNATIGEVMDVLVAVPQPALYAIGNDHPRTIPDKCVFYFKPGDRLSVAVNDTTYALTGRNTRENAALAAWHARMQPVERYVWHSSRYRTTFDAFLDRFLEVRDAEAQMKFPRTKNGDFDRLFAQVRRYDLLTCGVNFNPPRDADPHGRHYTEFYSRIDIPALTRTTALYRYPFGMALLKRLREVYPRISGTTPPVSADLFLGVVANDTLRGELVLEDAAKLKSQAGFEEWMRDRGRYVVTSSQQKRECSMREALAAAEESARQPFVDFRYPDASGREVSLSDFRGKYVLVDCWATWCVPCRAEMPYLHRLEEEFRGRDIVFVGISIDEPKNHAAWKEFLAKEGMNNIQLFAAGTGSPFMQAFRVGPIPRFMLFDRQGRILMPDAPRPSSPELKLVLENALKK